MIFIIIYFPLRIVISSVFLSTPFFPSFFLSLYFIFSSISVSFLPSFLYLFSVPVLFSPANFLITFLLTYLFVLLSFANFFPRHYSITFSIFIYSIRYLYVYLTFNISLPLSFSRNKFSFPLFIHFSSYLPSVILWLSFASNNYSKFLLYLQIFATFFPSSVFLLLTLYVILTHSESSDTMILFHSVLKN